MDKAVYGVLFDDGSQNLFRNIVEYHADDEHSTILLKDEKGSEIMINWNHAKFICKNYY